MSSILETLRERELIRDATKGTRVKKGDIAYIGFDATAPSLHIGSLLPIMLAKHLQEHGVKILVVLGGATTKVGDPSGKKKERKILPDDTIKKNISSLRIQLKNIFEDDVELYDNADWLGEKLLLDFLQNIARRVSHGRLLSLEAIKSRGKDLSVLEMLYPILQAYDFHHLYEERGCTIQIGGSDQWGNITMGIDLIRRISGKEDAYGITCPLLVDGAGNKMGKTEKGAIWLDPNLTTPADFWHHWRNVRDEDVFRFSRQLDSEFSPESNPIEGTNYSERKISLATNVTAMVHGIDVAEKAQENANIMSKKGKKRILELIRSNKIRYAEDLEPAITELEEPLSPDRIVNHFMWIRSLNQARKAVEQGLFKINGEVCKDPFEELSFKKFEESDGHVLVELGRRGALIRISQTPQS